MLSSTAQAVIMAAPEPGSVTVNFATINWFYYTILVAIVFLVLALKGDKGAWKALGVLVVIAVVYALFMVYVVAKLS